MDENQKLAELKRLAIDLFVKREEVDLTAPNVIAAITDAARNMSLVTDITSQYDVQDAILEAFNAKDDQKIAEFIEIINPSYVMHIIGFATDYRDYNSAMVAYQSQKEKYDKFYNMINTLKTNKEKSL